MVKRKTTRKRSTTPRARTVYRTAPRRRRTNKTGYNHIAPAMATVGLIVANKDRIKGLGKAITNCGSAKIGEYPSRIISNKWVHEQIGRFVSMDALTTDAMAVAGGYVAGELFNKFAPTFLKKPVAKLSKKIPKVI